MTDGQPVIRALREADVRRIYRDHLTRDFPDAERKPLFAIVRMLRRGQYAAYGCYDGDGLAGYAFFVVHSGETTCCLADYIAILPGKRDKGLGTAFQKALYAGELSGADVLLCEVEDPDTARDERQKELMERRIRHYLRVGWLDTGVAVRTFGVDFRLMEYPLWAAHGADRVKACYRELYRLSLPEALYRKMVVFR